MLKRYKIRLVYDHIYDPAASSEFSLNNKMVAIIQGAFGANRHKKVI